MTCREKLKIEYPESVDNSFIGGCAGCPDHYEYMPKPNYCVNNGNNKVCRRCWGREIPDTKPVKGEIKLTSIYYAHHQWKYGTKVEEYELDLIKRYFPHAVVFNPATDLKSKDCGDEAIIMDECVSKVLDSDIVIFSAMDGMIGIGVYNEVAAAEESGKLVLCLTQNKLHSSFHIYESPEFGSDRLYARVCVPMFE